MQKKLSHVWLISPWLPKPVLRARLKKELKSIKKEDAALKREGLGNLHKEQLKAVRQLWNVRFQKISIPTPRKVIGNSEREGGLMRLNF